MNANEILANLADLEQELENIQSARVLSENTIRSYQATQQEVVKLLAAFSRIEDLLKSLSTSLQSQADALGNEFGHGVASIEAALAQAKAEFGKSSAEAAENFRIQLEKRDNDLAKKTEGLTGDYAGNNMAFSDQISRLEQNVESYQGFLQNLDQIMQSLGQIQKDTITAGTTLNQFAHDAPGWLEEAAEKSTAGMLSALSGLTDSITQKTIGSQKEGEEKICGLIGNIGENHQEKAKELVSVIENGNSAAAQERKDIQDMLKSVGDKVGEISQERESKKKDAVVVRILLIINIIFTIALGFLVFWK